MQHCSKTTSTSIHDLIPLCDQSNLVYLTGNTLQLQAKTWESSTKNPSGARFFVPGGEPLAWGGPLARGGGGLVWLSSIPMHPRGSHTSQCACSTPPGFQISKTNLLVRPPLRFAPLQLRLRLLRRELSTCGGEGYDSWGAGYVLQQLLTRRVNSIPPTCSKMFRMPGQETLSDIHMGMGMGHRRRTGGQHPPRSGPLVSH